MQGEIERKRYQREWQHPQRQPHWERSSEMTEQYCQANWREVDQITEQPTQFISQKWLDVRAAQGKGVGSDSNGFGQNSASSWKGLRPMVRPSNAQRRKDENMREQHAGTQEPSHGRHQRYQHPLRKRERDLHWDKKAGDCLKSYSGKSRYEEKHSIYQTKGVRRNRKMLDRARGVLDEGYRDLNRRRNVWNKTSSNLWTSL